MGILELFRHPGMASEADFPGTILEKRSLVGGMRIVTPKALTLLNRLMHEPLVLLLGLVCVTRVAQILHLFLQHAFISGNMRAVAGEAFSGRHRLMFYFLLKVVAIMAGETVYLYGGSGLFRLKKAEGGNQGHYNGRGS